jgi:hypothetical protein
LVLILHPMTSGPCILQSPLDSLPTYGSLRLLADRGSLTLVSMVLSQVAPQESRLRSVLCQYMHSNTASPLPYPRRTSFRRFAIFTPSSALAKFRRRPKISAICTHRSVMLYIVSWKAQDLCHGNDYFFKRSCLAMMYSQSSSVAVQRSHFGVEALHFIF